MSAPTPAKPLLVSTLVIAAGTAAILVGCTRHTATPAQVQQAAASGATAYDDTSGQVVPSSAAPGSFKGGDATPSSGTANGDAGGTQAPTSSSANPASTSR